MRLVILALALAACGGGGGGDPPRDTPDDHLAAIYAEVDGDALIQRVKDMSGVNPVEVNGETFTIDQRLDDTGRRHFRAYWTKVMTDLGLAVTELDYQAADHPRPGVDLEAVLPGASADSVVVIVHYDSTGPDGEVNPGADDDMTGMSIMLETARILVAHKAELAYTVRFVATDEEEEVGLAGARYYADREGTAAQAAGYRLVAAVDDEQSGWNCDRAGLCVTPSRWPAFDVASCSGEGDGNLYDFPAIGDAFAAVADAYSPSLTTTRPCLGANSDHYAMWEIGVPAVVFSEHDPFFNPHFDSEGDDVFSRLDTTYYTLIARAAITAQAAIAGIQK